MWDNIIGQEMVIDTLRNVYSSRKIPHSLLFYGPEGSGKDAIAVEFAKLVNCENISQSLNSCGLCKSCKQISQLNSPEFKFIIALPSGKKETSDDEDPAAALSETDFALYVDAIKEKSKDPYIKIRIPKANAIRIDSIRNIKREIYLTGSKSKKKIFIISNADMMNPQASNALLKILEEPPGNSLIILTTSRLNSLLPTIIGRCQKVKFPPINKEVIRNYLLENYKNISPNDVDIYTALSEGNISRVKEYVESGLLELRNNVIDIIRGIVSNKNLKISNEINKVLDGKDKNRIRVFLQLFSIWFRDSLYIKNNIEERIINLDRRENLLNFTNKFDFNSFKIVLLIEEAIKNLESNLNNEVLLFQLVTSIQEQIRRK